MSSLLTLLTVLACAQTHVDPALQEATEKFVQADFAADPDRGLRLWFSPERSKQEQARDPYGGEQFDCQANAFVVVSVFRVVKIEQAADRASATVAFCRIGTASSLLSSVQADTPRVEHIRLKLVRRAEGWRALDPPEPRVSVLSALRCVREFLARASGPVYESHASLSSGERAVRERNVRAADILAKIESGHSTCGLDLDGQ